MCQEGTGPRWVSGVAVTGVWQAANMRSTGDRDETATDRDGLSGCGGAVRVDRFGEPVFTPPGEAVAVLAGLAELAGVDVRALDDDSCLGLFDALEVADRLFHSSRFALFAELHARDLTDRRLGHVVANEAAWRHGTDQRRVRRDLATANMLRRLPDVADALRDGTVSVDRVREVCRHLNDRTLDTFTSIQHELLDLMRAPSTWTAFTRDITQIASYADHDGVEPPRPRNHAAITRSGDTLAATIDVYGPESIGFEQRLNTEADRLYRQAVTDHNIDPTLEIPPRSELLAQAFINLVERGATAAASSSGRAPAADVTVVVDVDEATVADLFHDGILLPGPRDGAAVDWSHRVRDVTGARLRYSSREWELLTCDPTIAWVIVAAGGGRVEGTDAIHGRQKQAGVGDDRRLLEPTWPRGRIDGFGCRCDQRRSYTSVMAYERITVDPARMGGVPTIRDTRVTVGMVLGQLAAGRTVDDVLADYPYLERDDIWGALEFAAAAVNEREVPVAHPA